MGENAITEGEVRNKEVEMREKRKTRKINISRRKMM